MNRVIFSILLFISSFTGRDLLAAGFGCKICDHFIVQDTARNRQILYNGQIWRNSNPGIKGNPFFVTDVFLPGTIRVSGHLFSNVELKYDICSDEVLVEKDFDKIIQENKEMTDFFSLSIGNKVYRFIRIQNDTLKYFSGYVNELYKGRYSFYVKYIKEVISIINGKYLGEFNQISRMFILKDDRVWPVKKLSDVCIATKTEKSVLRSFIKRNKLTVTRKDPESFVPVIQYIDSMEGK